MLQPHCVCPGRWQGPADRALCMTKKQNVTHTNPLTGTRRLLWMQTGAQGQGTLPTPSEDYLTRLRICKTGEDFQVRALRATR